MARNNKDSTLVLVGGLILLIVNILNKTIGINEFIATALGLFALALFIIYLIRFFKTKDN